MSSLTFSGSVTSMRPAWWTSRERRKLLPAGDSTSVYINLWQIFRCPDGFHGDGETSCQPGKPESTKVGWYEQDCGQLMLGAMQFCMREWQIFIPRNMCRSRLTAGRWTVSFISDCMGLGGVTVFFLLLIRSITIRRFDRMALARAGLRGFLAIYHKYSAILRVQTRC